MLKFPRMYRYLAVLGFWLLTCAPAFASGGVDCQGHGAAITSHRTSAPASRWPDAQLASVAWASILQAQADVGPTLDRADATPFADDDQACGSCVHCAACCFSVAPPLSFCLPDLLVAQGLVFAFAQHHHASPDLATLERPPQLPPTRTTA